LATNRPLAQLSMLRTAQAVYIGIGAGNAVGRVVEQIVELAGQSRFEEAAMAKAPTRQSKLIRFLAMHAAVGVAVAVLMVGLALAFDVMNLWTLVSASDAGLLAVTVMTVFFAITFGSAQMGFALMFAMTAEAPPSSGRWRALFARLLPRRVDPSLVVVPPSRRR